MGRPLYTNNAASALAAGITSTQTTIQVQDGMGSLFPTPVGGDYFYVTLTSISIGGAFEIMQCTARSGDTMTVVRGVEGTSAQSFNIGDNVQLRITAAGMNFLTGQAVTSTEEEAQTATQGQTVFTLVNFDYAPGTNNLAVFVNGSKQVSGVNYSETNVNTVTFNTGLNAGDIVEFLVGVSVASGTLFANDVQYNEGSANAVTRTVAQKLQETISVKDFGAVGDGVADDTNAIQSALTYGGPAGKIIFFPAGKYKITSGLTYTPRGGGINMESVGYGVGIDADDYGIYAYGTGYTALTINPSRFNVLNICLGGLNNTLNGLYLNNPQQSVAGKIQVSNFNGFGVKIDRCFDCLFEAIAIQYSGNTSQYAFSMNDASETCNHTTINRLQTELCTAQVIYISPNSLSCFINNIHSEGATGTAGYTTWVLGANRGRYDVVRLEATNPAVANARIVGATSTFANLLTEGAIVVTAETSSATLAISIETPEIQGTLQAVNGNTGLINLFGGRINSFAGQAYLWNVFGTEFTLLTIGNSSNNPNYFRAFGARIGELVSGAANSAGTFNNCYINFVTSFLVNGIYNDCIILSNATITASYAACVFNNTTIDASMNISQIGGQRMSFVGQTYVTGTLTLNAGSTSACVFGPEVRIAAQSGLNTPPNGSAWLVGDTTKNIAPAVGSPKGWICTVAGTPGTWTSTGNL